MQTIESPDTSAVPPKPHLTLVKGALSRFKIPLIVALVVAILAGSFMAWRYLSSRQSTDDAYVDAHVHTISSKVSGTVTVVSVDDNQMVKAGQLLARIDARDYAVAVEQDKASLALAQKQADVANATISQVQETAAAQKTQAVSTVQTAHSDISSARSQIVGANAGIPQAQSQVAEAEAKVKEDALDLSRYKSLLAQGAVSKQNYDQAEEAYKISIAQRNQAIDSLKLARAKAAQTQTSLPRAQASLLQSQSNLQTAKAAQEQTLVAQKQYQAAQATVAKAAAQLDQSQLKLSYTQIKAPISGRIGRKSVEVGQLVEPGQALMSIVEPGVWVSANFKETQLGEIRPGAPAEIKVDSFAKHHFYGTVDSIAPASGAKFALLPPDNATGNFTKIVQRVPVKIQFNRDSIKGYENRITPGMSCVVTILVKQ